METTTNQTKEPETMKTLTIDNWTRTCRIGGQGLLTGRDYKITDLFVQIHGSDMVTTSGTVLDIDGEAINLTNLHIAFDLDDVIAQFDN